MSLQTHSSTKPLDKEGLFAVTLLAVCEITKNVLKDRTDPRSNKRMYWLDKLDMAIEGVNSTYDGYFADGEEDEKIVLEFHQAIEDAMNKLLTTLREKEENNESSDNAV